MWRLLAFLLAVIFGMFWDFSGIFGYMAFENPLGLGSTKKHI
jgi:hypothetical protein